jgi:hypothetical protein
MGIYYLRANEGKNQTIILVQINSSQNSILIIKEFLMNKKMLIALGASVCLSTAAFAAETTASNAASAGAAVVAPATPSHDAMPTKPTEQDVNKAKSADKKTEGKCAAGTCAAGKCSGPTKK